MDGNEAFKSLLRLRDRFLAETQRSRFHRDSTWYWGTGWFCKSPQLNQEWLKWSEQQGINLRQINALALTKTRRDFELERERDTEDDAAALLHEERKAA